MKRFFNIVTSIIIFGSLITSSVLAHSVYEKYNDTVRWENSSLLSKIHQVPPSLARNYISTEDQKLYETLVDINIALEEIEEEGEISDRKHNDYWGLYERAKEEIESRDEDEPIPAEDIFEDFELYLKADLAIKRAYTDLDVESLEGYTQTLSTRLKKEDSKIERALLDELHKVASAYKRLDEFSSSALNQLGVVEDDVLHVDIKVNRDITDQLLSEISSKKLMDFPHIRNLADILQGDAWDKILAHNSSSLKYYSWKESEAILNALSQSHYISVKSFDTVEDIVNYYPSIELEEKDNHTINMDSVVTGVYYNGEKLDESLYVKRGASLNFTVDYEYTENAKSTITVRYVDTDGNELANEESYTDYVDSPVQIDRKDIEGYTFIRIEDDLDKFAEDDHVITIVYEKYEPKPEVIEKEEDLDEKIEDLEDEKDKENEQDKEDELIEDEDELDSENE